MKRQFKIETIIENDFETVEEAREDIEDAYIHGRNCKIKQIHDIRTLQQNKALHKFFQQLADEFNAAGLEVHKVLSQEVEHYWTAITVKELIWRPLQKALLAKESTTQLDKVKEIDAIVSVINKFIGEKWGLYIAFPSLEQQYTASPDSEMGYKPA
jgi:hypothetical protein